MELSENLKLRLDRNPSDTPTSRLGMPAEPAAGPDGAPSDEAESAMRKALGLLGDSPRHRSDADRTPDSGAPRSLDRFGGGGGGLHRRRFIQDGDIPVTVVRREAGHDTVSQHRTPAPAAVPTSSRLQRTEAALAAETSARERAERLLHETNAVVRDLQTKIGHAELAKIEATEALRHEREVSAKLRADAETWESRLQEALEQAEAARQAAEDYQDQLTEERQARKTVERSLRAAEAERAAAEQLAASMTREAEAQETVQRKRTSADVDMITPSVRRKLADPARRTVARPTMPAQEPEPVKWWLNTKPETKRR
jgi:DNA polymerase III gamma/tau subunit